CPAQTAQSRGTWAASRQQLAAPASCCHCSRHFKWRRRRAAWRGYSTLRTLLPAAGCRGRHLRQFQQLPRLRRLRRWRQRLTTPYNEASSESPKTTSVAAPSTPLWLPPPPPPSSTATATALQPLQQHQQSSRSSTAVHSIYDRCSTPPPEEQQPQTLHNLVCRGLTVSFALDYVATAVTDPGTFLLAGYSRDQPASCNQIAVKTSTGFGVECLSIVTMPQTGVALVGEFGGTFDTLEQLVFHYHLHPIVRDESGTTVHLSQAYGYENSQRIVLFESTQGTYSLRAGADSNYVLSVRSQNIVAKLVIRVDKQSDCKNQFYLANSGPSGIVKYDSLEDLLGSLHSSRFPVTVSKNKILTTLQTPYQNSKACKAKQQSLLLDPLRQRIFHRGQEDQAVRALRLPSTQSGAFVVWLTSATEVSLMVRGQGQRVLSFKVVCTPTGCRALPERAVYLEKLPELKFDSIESLVAHLQCNPDLLMPELPGKLTQPISCRNL
uniref:SH2 domain-containing protein n=1 Tax=Macrostomum lignano TaxID=282301 RepID=A0A1I8IJS9_9PLAT